MNAAAAVLPQVDLVGIGGQDLVLVVAPVQQQGHVGLVELALQRALLGQIEVLDQLLRQRAGTLHGAPGHQVLVGGTGDALGIDAVVLVELAVLDRQQGLDQRGGNCSRRSRTRSSLWVG
jgi:hypothetical protein